MKNLIKIKQLMDNPLCLSLITIIGFYLFYFNQINTADFSFVIDSVFIIHPISKISNVSEYFQALIEYKVHDIQPIRDLFTFLELFLFKILKINTFLLGGLFIYTVSFIYLKKIAELLNFSKISKIFIFIFFLLHPSFHHTVLSLTQSKHLLAWMFSLMVIFHYLRFSIHGNEFKDKIKYNTFFILSLLSHAMFIFFPIFLVLNDILANRKKIIRAVIDHLFSLGISGVIGLGSYIYYRFGLNVHNGSNKILGSPINADDLLQLGRGFGQTILPLSTGTVFNASNYLNLLGLFLLIMFIYIGYKTDKRNRIKFFQFLSLSILAQASYLIYLTNFYLVDYYLLIPITCYAIMFSLVFESFKQFEFMHQLKKVVIILFIGLFAFKTVKLRSVIGDVVTYYKYGADTEKGCHNIYYYAQSLLRLNKFDQLKKIAPTVMDQRCYLAISATYGMMVLLMNYMVIMRDDISVEDKLEYFKAKPKTLQNKLAMAAFQAKYNLPEVEKSLEEVYELSEKYKFNRTELHDRIKDKFFSNYISNYCKNKQSDVCQKFIKLDKTTEYIKPVIPSRVLLDYLINGKEEEKQEAKAKVKQIEIDKKNKE